MQTLLNKIRTHSTQNNIPIITPPTQSFLEKTLKETKPQRCLEVGGCIGYSTIFIGNILNQRGGNVISFEISYPSYKQALKNINSSGLNNVTIYNTNFSEQPLDVMIDKKSLDFIFIDAMKKDYLEYYMLCKEFMAPNCIIIFDDVIKYADKMNNLYIFLSENQLNYEILKLDEDDGIIVVRQ